MLPFTLNEFLEPFYPDENEPIWLIGFPAKELPAGHVDKERKFKREVTRKSLSTNQILRNNLIAANKNLGLYFGVNAGGTTKEDINRFNACYCEYDDLTFEQQHKAFDECPLPPTIRVHTHKSVHAYWLLEQGATLEDWCSIQHGLIDKFQCDAQLKNENRVMRLPFLNHLLWADDKYVFTKVQIERFDATTRFKIADLKQAFPFVKPTPPKFIEKGYEPDTWEGVKQELRYRIMQLPTYRIESNGVWAVAKGICHDGRNNSALSVNLRTGAVSCKAGCDFDRILFAFGLEKPRRVSKILKVPAPEQKSELYRYIMGER